MNLIRNFTALLIILMVFISCQEENEPSIDQKGISIQEVQDFVNHQTPKNGRSASTLDIIYDLGIYKEITLGDAIFFPISLQEELYVSGTDSTMRFPVSSTSYTMAYKQGDKIFVDLIQPVPTTNDAVFTGYVLISQYSGDVKRILYYKNGEFTHEKNGRSSSGRASGLDCETTYYFNCWDVTIEGDTGPMSCEYDGSRTTCRLTDDGSDYTPSDEIIDAGPKGGGGGGTGGSSPADEKNCENPFAPGVMVPCNDNTCGEGMESDGNGGCREEQNGCELALVAQYPSAARKILSNRTRATNKTIEIFGYNGYNDCSDAFRHAYFNMLNTLDVGATITRKFGEAHECNSSNATETEMDLHNNEIGIQTALFNPNVPERNLTNFLLEKLYNGDMKLISNLGSGNKPTSSSKVLDSSSCKE